MSPPGAGAAARESASAGLRPPRPPLARPAFLPIVASHVLAAALLTLPVAWVYTLTHERRGFRQSVVQTLIILPIVVAGVVLMMVFNLAEES
mgnify:CR=1 FL=1